MELLVKSILLILWTETLASHTQILPIQYIYIYIYIFIYLYYIKFTYVFSSTISGLLNFFAHCQQKSNNAASVGFLFCSLWFCVSFLLFLGWVSCACTIGQRAEGCSGLGAAQDLLGRRHGFEADGGRGPPLGLRQMEPGRQH